MTDIKFKSGGHDEEQEPGAVAMFGYGSSVVDSPKYISCSFLIDTVVRGLEILSIVFLLLILYEHISANNLVYILVPFSLTFLLASVSSSAVHYDIDDSVGMSDYVLKCWERISAMQFGALISIFAAKCALIYIYSKNLSDTVSFSKSLSALINDSVDQPLAVIVPKPLFITSLVCICFIMIVESGILINGIVHVAAHSSRIYPLTLSFIDTLGVSMFLFIHRLIEMQKELVHFKNIVTSLPKFVLVVAMTRGIIGLIIYLFSVLTKDSPMTAFASLNILVAYILVAYRPTATYGTLDSLKSICGIAISERVLVTILHLPSKS